MAQPPAHPHPGWYAAPAAALAVSVASVATALKVWALDKVAWTLKDVNASNGDWQVGWDHHDSTIRIYLALALIACGLAIGALTAIVGARGRTNT